MLRHFVLNTPDGFKILDAKLNVHVGDGKGSVLVLPSRESAETILNELTSRLGLLGTFNAPEPRLPSLPQDSDNDEGHDSDDLPMLLSVTSRTMVELSALVEAQDMGDLSADDFAKVARPNSERVGLSRVREMMSAPAGERPRVYALWNGQVVAVTSTYYVDRYQDAARAWWIGHTTVQDMIRPA